MSEKHKLLIPETIPTLYAVNAVRLGTADRDILEDRGWTVEEFDTSFLLCKGEGEQEERLEAPKDWILVTKEPQTAEDWLIENYGDYSQKSERYKPCYSFDVAVGIVKACQAMEAGKHDEKMSFEDWFGVFAMEHAKTMTVHQRIRLKEHCLYAWNACLKSHNLKGDG